MYNHPSRSRRRSSYQAGQFNFSPNWAEISRWSRNIGSALALVAPYTPILDQVPHVGAGLSLAVYVVGSVVKDLAAWIQCRGLENQGPK